MAPKSAAAKAKEVEVEEEVLQAVILADSFNTRFMPLTASTPRCLLPICNAPLLDWTFESLALAGIQEIFVVVRSHADKVKDAIKASKWSHPSSGLRITPIVTAHETFSAGDAMRDIYTHGVITGDFVLVAGDLVSNVKIDEIIRIHKERRKVDKDAIMTMVLKPSGARHRTKSRGENSLIMLDPSSNECLHYVSSPSHPPSSSFPIPLQPHLSDHAEIEIRTDLIDCGIDVCALEVPSLFQDNFDYQDLRRDFVHGVLTSDLLMKKIHVHVLDEGYAARVKDTRSYDAVSRDILSRWVFPLVPDDNHPAGHVYEHTRGNRYTPKDHTAVLARTCKVGPNTLIGAATHIFDNASVSHSVIGARVRIGPGAVIQDSYVFDDVVVGAGARIERAIVGRNVSVGKEVRIGRGCLVGEGVVLGDGAELREFERVAVQGPEEDDDGEESGEKLSEQETEKILGKGSNARIWPYGKPEEEDELDAYETWENLRLTRLGDDVPFVDDPGSETDDSDIDADSSDGYSVTSSSFNFPTRASSVTSAGIGGANVLDGAAEKEFLVEVRLSLDRAFDEGHSVENAAVELKTLRMASNVPIAAVRHAIIGAIVDRTAPPAAVEGQESTPAQQRANITKFVQRWGALVNEIGGIDQVEAILQLQEQCAKDAERTGRFGQLLGAWYQCDVVEEEHVGRWHRMGAAKGEGKSGEVQENMKRCWVVGGVLLKQLEAQSEESEEESD